MVKMLDILFFTYVKLMVNLLIFLTADNIFGDLIFTFPSILSF